MNSILELLMSLGPSMGQKEDQARASDSLHEGLGNLSVGDFGEGASNLISALISGADTFANIGMVGGPRRELLESILNKNSRASRARLHPQQFENSTGRRGSASMEADLPGDSFFSEEGINPGEFANYDRNSFGEDLYAHLEDMAVSAQTRGIDLDALFRSPELKGEFARRMSGDPDALEALDDTLKLYTDRIRPAQYDWKVRAIERGDYPKRK